MTDLPRDLWERAKRSWNAAKATVAVDPDSCASRAYYAAFYAVSARFAKLGQTFTKHSAVEAAVHRDLVKAGLWTARLGQEYSRLVQARLVGDYGGGQHVTVRAAEELILLAARVLQAIWHENPDCFPDPPSIPDC